MLPASAYLEMALAAAAEVFGAQSVALKDVEFRQGAFLARERNPDDSGDPLSRRRWSGILSHLQSRGRRSRPANHGRCMRTGKVCLQQDSGTSPGCSGRRCSRRSRARCSEKISGQDYYLRLRESGIHYGPFFQSIAQLWRHNGDVLGEVRVPDGPDAEFNAFQFIRQFWMPGFRSSERR